MLYTRSTSILDSYFRTAIGITPGQLAKNGVEPPSY